MRYTDDSARIIWTTFGLLAISCYCICFSLFYFVRISFCFYFLYFSIQCSCTWEDCVSSIPFFVCQKHERQHGIQLSSSVFDLSQFSFNFSVYVGACCFVAEDKRFKSLVWIMLSQKKSENVYVNSKSIGNTPALAGRAACFCYENHVISHGKSSTFHKLFVWTHGFLLIFKWARVFLHAFMNSIQNK